MDGERPQATPISILEGLLQLGESDRSAGPLEVNLEQIVDVQGLSTSLPLWTPEPYRSLVQDCWQGQPSARPTFDRIIDLLKAMVASADDLEPSEPHPHFLRSGTPSSGMMTRLENASDAAVAGSLLGIGDGESVVTGGLVVCSWPLVTW